MLDLDAIEAEWQDRPTVTGLYIPALIARIREQDAEIARLRNGIQKAWNIESADPATDLCEVRDILFGLRAASKGEQ